MTNNMFYGIDVGGTFIKGAIVADGGKIVYSEKIPTDPDNLAECILQLCAILKKGANLTQKDICGMGIGLPGLVDTEKGVLLCAENLSLYNYPIKELVEKEIGIPVKIANDANAAALGEHLYGVGKNYRSSVMITLGTGVGGGIVIDGKLFEGNRGAGAEIGHTVIEFGGEKCSCGRRGCLEAYASATALIRQTKKAMTDNPKSKLWEIGSLDAVDGKTAFDFYALDADAKNVVDGYVEKLASGIANFINIFRPEAIILGGGVCAQGETLLRPIKKLLENEIFAYGLSPEVDIVIAERKNDAGALGAASLLIN